MGTLNTTAALIAAALRLRAIEDRSEMDVTLDLALLRFSNPQIQDWLIERLIAAQTADRKAR